MSLALTIPMILPRLEVRNTRCRPVASSFRARSDMGLSDATPTHGNRIRVGVLFFHSRKSDTGTLNTSWVLADSMMCLRSAVATTPMAYAPSPLVSSRETTGQMVSFVLSILRSAVKSGSSYPTPVMSDLSNSLTLLLFNTATQQEKYWNNSRKSIAWITRTTAPVTGSTIGTRLTPGEIICSKIRRDGSARVAVTTVLLPARLARSPTDMCPTCCSAWSAVHPCSSTNLSSMRTTSM
mmetsp:Transcript_36605/g.77723  ORF Transcript_36605/g.77723 Transcript_36605/m.77723 type:complete len:238 (-) Transcript_36605:511-1224(-)